MGMRIGEYSKASVQKDLNGNIGSTAADVGSDGRVVTSAVSSSNIAYVYWRASDLLGVVFMMGSPGDMRATSTTVERLARVAIRNA
jgi:hypothetical protein